MKELYGTAFKYHRGTKIHYNEVYHLAPHVDELTGKIDPNNMVKTYTKDQVMRNLKSLQHATQIIHTDFIKQ